MLFTLAFFYGTLLSLSLLNQLLCCVCAAGISLEKRVRSGDTIKIRIANIKLVVQLATAAASWLEERPFRIKVSEPSIIVEREGNSEVRRLLLHLFWFNYPTS